MDLKLTGLNKFSRLWGLRLPQAVWNLVLGGVQQRNIVSQSVREEVVGSVGSGLVCMNRKDALPGTSFAICKN